MRYARDASRGGSGHLRERKEAFPAAASWTARVRPRRFSFALLLLLPLLLRGGELPQNVKELEELSRKIEELSRKLDGASPEELEKLTKELQGLSDEAVETGFTGPCAQFVDSPTHACVPIVVQVSQATEYRDLEERSVRARNKPPEKKVIVRQYYVYEYAAEEEGELVYARDFSGFRLHAPYRPLYSFKKPTKCKVTRAGGYRQHFRWNNRQERDELKRFSDKGMLGINSINKTFALSASFPPLNEDCKTNIKFGPIAILVANEDRGSPDSGKSAYDPLFIDPARTGEGETVDFILTPDMVREALEKKEFRKTLKWGRKVGEHGGLHTSTLTIAIKIGEPCEEEGVLAVSPPSGLDASGPDEGGHFVPATQTYTLENVGDAEIAFAVSKEAPWLSLSAERGSLAPAQTATVVVTINEKARELEDGLHTDMVVFTNATNGKGSTSRMITVDVGEEQKWRVSLTGQETDDTGGKLMMFKMRDRAATDYGIRFDFALVGEFTIKKKKGGWRYTEGQIVSGEVKYSANFDPAVFSVTDYAPKGFEHVTGLKGQSLYGEVVGNAVRLTWPEVRPAVVVTNKVKLAGEDEGHSKNWFEAGDFMRVAWTHHLPLKEGEYVPEPVAKTSPRERFPQDARKPTLIHYRYLLTRLDGS